MDIGALPVMAFQLVGRFKFKLFRNLYHACSPYIPHILACADSRMGMSHSRPP